LRRLRVFEDFLKENREVYIKTNFSSFVHF
jgi:hypothetical protein